MTTKRNVPAPNSSQSNPVHREVSTLNYEMTNDIHVHTRTSPVLCEPIPESARFNSSQVETGYRNEKAPLLSNAERHAASHYNTKVSRNQATVPRTAPATSFSHSSSDYLDGKYKHSDRDTVKTDPELRRFWIPLRDRDPRDTRTQGAGLKNTESMSSGGRSISKKKH